MNVMADPTNAAAGTDGPTGGQSNNPDGYSSPHDRNLWVLATMLFKESFERETGGKYPFNPAQLWREQCEVCLPLPEVRDHPAHPLRALRSRADIDLRFRPGNGNS